MTNTTLAAGSATRASNDLLSIALVAMLGVGLIFVAGFSNAAGLHDVGHDQRHAIAFPCH